MEESDLWKILRANRKNLKAGEEAVNDLWQTLEVGPVDYGWMDKGDFFSPAPFQEPILSQLSQLWTDENGVTSTGQPNRFVPNKTYVKKDDANRNFLFDTETVVKESKKLLMAGLSGERFVQQLKAKFSTAHLEASEEALKAVLAKDYGLLGPLMAEIGNVFATCQEADAFFKKANVPAPYLTKMAKCNGCRFFCQTSSVCGVTSKKLVDEVPATQAMLEGAITARKNSGLMTDKTASALLASDAPLLARIKKANLTKEVPEVRKATATVKAVSPTKPEVRKAAKAITAAHVVGSLQKGTSVKDVEALLSTRLGKLQGDGLVKAALGQISLPITAFSDCQDPKVQYVVSLKVASSCVGCRYNLGFACGKNGKTMVASRESSAAEPADAKRLAAEMNETFSIPSMEVTFNQVADGLDISQIVPGMGEWII